MPEGKRTLKQAQTGIQRKKANNVNYIAGILGFVIAGKQQVDVPGRSGFVYVRLRSATSEVIQAFNSAVSLTYDLPVLVSRDVNHPNYYQVVGVDKKMYSIWNSPYLAKHGSQHSFYPPYGGGDITWIYGNQFMPLLGHPGGASNPMNVLVNEYKRNYNGEWQSIGSTGTASLIPYLPTDDTARMVLVYMDSVGNPQLRPSTGTFSVVNTDPYSIVSNLPILNVAEFPVCGVRLVSGTNLIGWEDIYDLRDYFGESVNISSGTSGGGHAIENAGTPLAQRTNLNFLGGLVAYDDSVNNATIVSGTFSGGISEAPIDGNAYLRENAGWTLYSGTPGGGFNPFWATEGVLVTGTNISSTFIIPYACAISEIILQMKFLGSSGTTVIDIDLNGTTIFTTQANRPSLAWNAGSNFVSAIPDITNLAIGDILSFDIDGVAVGAGTATIEVVLSSSAARAGHSIQDEGSALAQRAALDFVGLGVTALDDLANNRTKVTIPGFRELISEQTPSGVNYVEFTSIPATYKRLVLEIAMRSDAATTSVYAYIEFNGDTADANYRETETFSYGAGTTDGGGYATRYLTTGICGGNSPANEFTIGQVLIPFYTSAINKQILYHGAHKRDASSLYEINYTSVLDWMNTAAINAIKILLSSGNFVAGSIVRLYGENV